MKLFNSNKYVEFCTSFSFSFPSFHSVDIQAMSSLKAWGLECCFLEIVIPSNSMTVGLIRNLYCKLCDKIRKLSEASFITTCVDIYFDSGCQWNCHIDAVFYITKNDDGVCKSEWSLKKSVSICAADDGFASLSSVTAQRPASMLF